LLAERVNIRSVDDLEQERRELRRVLPLGLAVFVLFFGLDLFVVHVLHSQGGVLWFAGLRLVGVLAIAPCALLVRRPSVSRRGMRIAAALAFIFAAAVISVMALRYGGLDSRYLQGVAIVIMYRAASIPGHWRPSLLVGLACALTFPAVMAITAGFDASVAAQWRDGASLWMFVHDYVFVLATCTLGAVGSHMVWSARRQVFEARRLGRYRLKARIGSGGSGEVWLARDEQGRDVALKILHAQSSQVPMARLRFEREARAAASLHDPHTIRVIDWGASDDGVYFIAMELLDGSDLATLVRQSGPLPLARALSFIGQACESLAEAHAAGIFHRDIKPANLFAANVNGERDFLKLLDFGLAKLPRGADELTVTHEGWIGGTPSYMAPEACAGTPTDERSDLYSLGAVLYFLVTGRAPFVAQTAAQVMMAHLNEAPLPPSQLAALPPSLDALVLRCLAKRPDDRFQTVRALQQALEELRGATFKTAG
jgi:hypothetical protein